MRYDAIVVGLGAMGGAALAELARRGRRVLGIEQFHLPHARGSSQGGTRIIREAYFEHPLYVPLVRRAYDAWQALERRTSRRLLVPTGGLTIGPPDGRLVAGALASARTHGLAHEILDAAAVAHRHPAVRIPEGAAAVFEPRAGVLLAARAVAALLDVARADGAEVRDGVIVDGWEADARGVRVRVAGQTLEAHRLVLAAGPWMSALVPALASLLRVERNVVHWFRPEAPTAAGVGAFGPEALPVLVVEDRPEHLLYALPSMRELGDDLEDGVKFARHHGGVFGPIDALEPPGAADASAIGADVARYLPGLRPEPVRSATCAYTNTPDGHFLIDRHPAYHAVILLSPCSGHGFKFAPVVGTLAADFVHDVNVHGNLPPFAFRAV